MGAAAVVLGACLAAFYLLPAIYEQKLGQYCGSRSAARVRRIIFFSFIPPTPITMPSTRHLLGGGWQRSLLTIAQRGRARRLWRAAQSPSSGTYCWRGRRLHGADASGYAACLWKFLPKLRFMQFPWRWLLCLSMSFALFVTCGVPALDGARCAICLAMLCVIGFGVAPLQAPWWDNAADLREMQDNMATGTRATKAPTNIRRSGADPSAIDKDAPQCDCRRPGTGRDSRFAVGCRVEAVHGGDVCAGSAALASVQLSRVASGS